VERSRNLERTRERIVRAALAEFAAHGLAGARCDHIVRRARVNKRMLFYCFGSKEELYREVLRRKFTERANLYEDAPGDIGRAILHWYRAFSGDLEWVRLLEWEALDSRPRPLLGAKDRRYYLSRTLDGLRRAQIEGLVQKDVDLVQLQISIIALTAFPLAFPQMTRLATGLTPTDPRFVRRRIRFLRWLGERLSTATASVSPAQVSSSKLSAEQPRLKANRPRPPSAGELIR
jgi:TetR/AcrR family transcriptional regulator